MLNKAFKVGLKEMATSNKNLNAVRQSPILGEIPEVQRVPGRGNSHYKGTKNMPATFKG